MSQTSPYPVRPGVGVLTSSGGTPILTTGVVMETSRAAVTATLVDGTEENYPTSEVSVDPQTARMEFVSNDTTYRIRELRETDGSWLSVYKTDLPAEALRAFAKTGEDMDIQETLDAFALEDSVYVVGLVYTNGMGRWSRVDGDWILLASDDATYEGLEAISIDADRAQSFITLFDKNFVTVTDAEKYESAGSQDIDLAEATPTE